MNTLNPEISSKEDGNRDDFQDPQRKICITNPKAFLNFGIMITKVPSRISNCHSVLNTMTRLHISISPVAILIWKTPNPLFFIWASLSNLGLWISKKYINTMPFLGFGSSPNLKILSKMATNSPLPNLKKKWIY